MFWVSKNKITNTSQSLYSSVLFQTSNQNELTDKSGLDLGTIHPYIEIKANVNVPEKTKQVDDEATFKYEKKEDAEAITAMILATSVAAVIHSKFLSSESFSELVLSSTKTITSLLLNKDKGISSQDIGEGDNSSVHDKNTNKQTLVNKSDSIRSKIYKNM